MTSKAKVLVIGMDSAEPTLLMNWCASGELPVLRALKDRGVYGKLSSPPLMADDAAWPSFSTSVSPARHGRFFWQSVRSGSYDTSRFRDEDWKHESFWNVLSRAGKKVAIIDVPKCQLSRNLNGIQLANWLVHGRDSSTCSWPHDFAETILSRFGDDQTDLPHADEYLCSMETLSENQLRRLLQRLLDSVERKLSVAMEVLNQGNWDLFVTVFKECHCAGHQFWHLLDQQHPKYDQTRACELGDSLKTVYQMVDRAVGQLLKVTDAGTTVIVFTDLGMGPNYTGEPYLDQVLMRLESRVSAKLQPAFRTLGRIQAKLYGKPGGYRHAYRKAFQLPHNEISGAIRINLKGREPAGRVQPGRELEEFLDCLSRDLLDLIDPNTGQPVVRQVTRTATLFEGEHADCLPDLLVEWNRDFAITAVSSKKIGEIRTNTPMYRTGNHIADGMYFAQGPLIAPEENGQPASLVDIGPTVAALLETPLPDVDGKPVTAICGKKSAA